MQLEEAMLHPAVSAYLPTDSILGPGSVLILSEDLATGRIYATTYQMSDPE